MLPCARYRGRSGRRRWPRGVPDDALEGGELMNLEFLWYVPNTVESGHRGDDTAEGWGSLDFSAAIAHTAEEHGFHGALIGAGWGRTDTFTLCTALAART